MASGLPLGQIAVTRCAVIVDVDRLILPDPPKPWLGSFAKKLARPSRDSSLLLKRAAYRSTE
jgi:hypothetical protein